MKFSILIPTLEERAAQFQRLSTKLRQQIAEHALENEVEIISFIDKRQHSVGFKRNWLMDQAQGEFTAFVDDDDDVSQEYVSLIDQTIRAHPEIDCIGIKQVITFAEGQQRISIHSLQYTQYFTRGGIYYRPPYHLNPIRRKIAIQYRFEEINYSEDIDWAMRMCRDRALQHEYFIDKILYYYHSQRSWRYQYLLDLTEPVRHALGLQLANRLRIKRWIRSCWGKTKENNNTGKL